MKLHGTIDLFVSGERILRRPNLWDKLKRSLGAGADLDTRQLRSALEATAVVDAANTALRKLGITNAISLVIDDHVIFQDKEGRPDDLGDLFVAFHDSASVFGAGFDLLRLAAEHEEAGLHTVVEVVARTEYPVGEPAGRIVISGRIKDLEPRKGEDADAYRARVEPLTRDPLLLEAHRRQFESFVARVCEAIRSSMPEARTEIRSAEARVEKPSKRPRRAPAPAPTDPRYDPYAHHYPHPLDGMLTMMMWGSLFSMSMTPDVVVVNEHGDSLGHASDGAGGFDDSGEPGGDVGDVGDGGDPGGGDGGGDGGWDGGDFDGGDFGDF